MAKKLTSIERKIVALEAVTNKISTQLSIRQKALLSSKLKLINAKLDEILVADTTYAANSLQVELNALVKQQFNEIAALQVADLDKLVTKVYNNTRIQVGKELGTSFDVTNDFQLNELKNRATDGMTFSQRLYQNNTLIGERVNNNIGRMLYMQASPTDIKRALQKDFNISWSAADRLIRTEASKFYNNAAQDSYRAAGISKVEWLTEKDDRTCEICGPLDGKQFPVGGISAPAHPNCRCTILPVIED